MSNLLQEAPKLLSEFKPLAAVVSVGMACLNYSVFVPNFFSRITHDQINTIILKDMSDLNLAVACGALFLGSILFDKMSAEHMRWADVGITENFSHVLVQFLVNKSHTDPFTWFIGVKFASIGAEFFYKAFKENATENTNKDN